MVQRRYSSKSLPAYIFIPGKNPHPMKENGHWEGQKDPLVVPIDTDRPWENLDLCYALDLLNFGYSWESHVYFEALWNAHRREGPVADFLKGLIKLGAARVKLSLGQRDSFQEHLRRASELFTGVMESYGPRFLGFNLAQLLQQLEQVSEGKSAFFELHPEWDLRVC
jgi:hypothetical protein